MSLIVAALEGGEIFAICMAVILLFLAWQFRHHHRHDGRGPGGKP